MGKNALFFLISMIGLKATLLAQSNKQLDSLQEAYNYHQEDSSKVNTAAIIFEELFKSNPATALTFATEGFTLAKKINYNRGMATSEFQIGTYYKLLRRNDSAEYYLTSALKKFEALKDDAQRDVVNFHLLKLKNQKGQYKEALEEINEKITYHENTRKDALLLARYLDLKASTHRYLTEYDIGLKSAFEAVDIAEKLNNKELLLDCYTTIANLYHYIIDNKNANLYCEKALNIAREGNFRRAEANLLNNLGNSYYFQKRYQEALTHLENSLAISKEIEANDLISITNFNLGKLHIAQDNFTKGLSFLEASIQHSRTVTKNPVYLVWGLNGLTNALNKSENSKEAITFANEAIKIADSIGNLDDLSLAYEQRSESHERLGNYQKALEDFQFHKKVNDSVYNISKSKEIRRLTTQFETKEKERQIVLQKKEITVLEQEASISHLQRTLLGIGLLLSLIGFYAIRQKMKRNKLEKEKVDAELEFKRKELTTHALNLARKNETLENLRLKAQELKEKENTAIGYNQLIRSINFDLQDDNNWANFSRYFEEVHKDFNSKVKSKYPQVTSNELRLLALLKMNLSSKEIANILNISSEGIKKARYRLRKKLELSSEDSLNDLVLSL